MLEGALFSCKVNFTTQKRSTNNERWMPTGSTCLPSDITINCRIDAGTASSFERKFQAGIRTGVATVCESFTYTVVPVMNGHPRDQAKVFVHCRWPLIRGNLTLKCVGRGIDNVAVQGRWPLTTGVAQGRYYCTYESRKGLIDILPRPERTSKVEMLLPELAGSLKRETTYCWCIRQGLHWK